MNGAVRKVDDDHTQQEKQMKGFVYLTAASTLNITAAT